MKPNESVNDYYADLVVMARHAFPGSSKDSRIFETFVANIGNDGMRVHLLSKDVKDIDQALSEALRFEKIRGVISFEDRVNRVMGERENPHVTALRNAQGRPQQHNQRTNHSPGSEITCYRCGARGHISRTCTPPRVLVRSIEMQGRAGMLAPTTEHRRDLRFSGSNCHNSILRYPSRVWVCSPRGNSRRARCPSSIMIGLGKRV